MCGFGVRAIFLDFSASISAGGVCWTDIIVVKTVVMMRSVFSGGKFLVEMRTREPKTAPQIVVKLKTDSRCFLNEDWR